VVINYRREEKQKQTDGKSGREKIIIKRKKPEKAVRHNPFCER
jgi:hypothetical protein